MNDHDVLADRFSSNRSCHCVPHADRSDRRPALRTAVAAGAGHADLAIWWLDSEEQRIRVEAWEPAREQLRLKNREHELLMLLYLMSSTPAAPGLAPGSYVAYSVAAAEKPPPCLFRIGQQANLVEGGSSCSRKTRKSQTFWLPVEPGSSAVIWLRAF